MKRNAELLRKAADAIEKEPGSYNQRWWTSYVFDDKNEFCGTVCCIAGHAIVQHGGSLRWDQRDFRRTYWKGPTLYSKGKRRLGDDQISEYAARILGLTEEEAEMLFHSEMLPLTLDPWEVHTRPALAAAVADALRRIADGAPVDEVVS